MTSSGRCSGSGPQSLSDRLKLPLTKQQMTNLGEGSETMTVTNSKKKVGVNDPCPCGSGKKYKHCHGRRGAKAA